MNCERCAGTGWVAGLLGQKTKCPLCGSRCVFILSGGLIFPPDGGCKFAGDIVDDPCDKTLADCRKHGQEKNFGGMPLMPKAVHEEHADPVDRFKTMAPLDIFKTWQHGCGNTIPFMESPDRCAECTEAMMSALQNALTERLPSPAIVQDAERTLDRIRHEGGVAGAEGRLAAYALRMARLLDD